MVDHREPLLAALASDGRNVADREAVATRSEDSDTELVDAAVTRFPGLAA